ncbi:hypothetical protein ACFQT4_17675 [Pseudoduganella danionis]|uniref:hypothetical protein n=1 Tax=Pseudoduganella danionis TaxID=1890295 RepID=UPI0036118012
MRRLAIKIESGISYSDYKASFIESKIDVTNFIEGPSTKALPQVALHILDASKHYEIGLKFWGTKFQNSPNETKASISLKLRDVVLNEALSDWIRNYYPNMRRVDSNVSPDHLDYSKVIQHIFLKAAEETNQAQELLK